MSYKTLFIWYHPKMAQLEKAIRQKWVTTKDLVNIVLNKFKEKDNYFNPMRYLGGDEEKYFEILQQWKIDFEKSYLEQFPHLRRAPICHKKCLARSTRLSLRSFLFIFLEPCDQFKRLHFFYYRLNFFLD